MHISAETVLNLHWVAAAIVCLPLVKGAFDKGVGPFPDPESKEEMAAFEKQVKVYFLYFFFAALALLSYYPHFLYRLPSLESRALPIVGIAIVSLLSLFLLILGNVAFRKGRRK